MRRKATEVFEKRAVDMREGYWVRNGLGIWVLLHHGHVACIRNVRGEIDGRLYNDGWPSATACPEYSDDLGKTWHPRAGEPRGIKPGDVFVRAGTDEPLGYMLCEEPDVFLANLHNGWIVCDPSVHTVAGRLKVNIADLDIIDGPEADTLIGRIVRGEFAKREGATA